MALLKGLRGTVANILQAKVIVSWSKDDFLPHKRHRHIDDTIEIWAKKRLVKSGGKSEQDCFEALLVLEVFYLFIYIYFDSGSQKKWIFFSDKTAFISTNWFTEMY